MKLSSLRALHEQAGAQFRELSGSEVVSTYGSVEREYRALRESAALADLSHRGLVRLTGTERVDFLHGMVTNDVKGLPEGHAAPAALLTAKGAMVSDTIIWRRPTDLLLEVEPGLAQKVIDFLSTYLISEDAELADASLELALLGLGGPQARATAQAAFGIDFTALPVNRLQAFTAQGQQAWALADDRWGKGALKLLLPVSALEPVWRQLSSLERPPTPVGFEALETVRVEGGIPRYGQDMDDKTIPLEANLEGSIHYNKGCYIGQEVIARATFRGHMNRKLTGLLLGEGVPASRAELFKAERKVGWVTSVVASPALGQRIALAYVHRDFLEAGTELRLLDGATVKVHPLPFVSS